MAVCQHRPRSSRSHKRQLHTNRHPFATAGATAHSHSLSQSTGGTFHDGSCKSKPTCSGNIIISSSSGKSSGKHHAAAHNVQHSAMCGPMLCRVWLCAATLSYF
jgi:hypothetical protein